MQVRDIQQQDEYETDSDMERVDDKVEFEVMSKTNMTRSGRAVHAFSVRLDL